MTCLDLLMVSVMMLQGGDPDPGSSLNSPQMAVGEQGGSIAGDIEEEYARRDRDAGSLAEFKGGAGAGGLEVLFLPILALGGLLKLFFSALGSR